LDAEPEGWLDGAEKVPGSWWPAWYAWLAPLSGAQTDAPSEPGNAEYTAIEEAPGAYVREKAS
jgi:polyhydroxyalkanoate synthase